MLKNTIYFLVLALFVSACTLEPEEFEASKGTADFSNTIFVGNSLTAGFRDGELYQSGQMESFPSIIAQSLIEAGFMTSFNQPFMPDEVGFGERLKLDYSADCTGEIGMGPVSYGVAPDLASVGANIADFGPFQNLGVPGAQVGHLLYSGYAALNPYFGRFASSPNATILSEATAQNPTFTVLWIGNNDVLGFATSGGDDPTKPITPAGEFATYLDLVVQGLSANNAKGVMCNIPDVTSTAFFTTVPYNAIPVTNEEDLNALNAGYAEYNAGVAQMVSLGYDVDSIKWTLGANALVIEDFNPLLEQLGYRRQIKPGELVRLNIPQDSIKCYGWGTLVPVPEKYILDEQELAEIEQATIAFNNTINSVAATYGWGVTDVNGILNNIAANGLRIEGKNYTTTFVTGNLFSLDGIHLTGNGNAIVANEIIETINNTFNASIPKTMVSQYTGVELP
jgi:hypothetical protein